jgi:hypothetical protein
MKRSKLTPTAPLDNTSSPTAPTRNSPPTYDQTEDPEEVWLRALISGLDERLQKQEAEKKKQRLRKPRPL